MLGFFIQTVFLFTAPPFWLSEGVKPELSVFRQGRILELYVEAGLEPMVAEIHYFDDQTRDETLSFQMMEPGAVLGMRQAESLAYAVVKIGDFLPLNENGTRRSAHKFWRVLPSQNKDSHQLTLINMGDQDAAVTLYRKSFDGVLLDSRRIRIPQARERILSLAKILPPIENSFIEVDATQPVGLSVSTCGQWFESENASEDP